MNTSHPIKQGLYDPQFEHDACGIGFIAQMKGAKSHEIVAQALIILVNLDHRLATARATMIEIHQNCQCLRHNLMRLRPLHLRDKTDTASIVLKLRIV